MKLLESRKIMPMYLQENISREICFILALTGETRPIFPQGVKGRLSMGPKPPMASGQEATHPPSKVSLRWFLRMVLYWAFWVNERPGYSVFHTFPPTNASVQVLELPREQLHCTGGTHRRSGEAARAGGSLWAYVPPGPIAAIIARRSPGSTLPRMSLGKRKVSHPAHKCLSFI